MPQKQHIMHGRDHLSGGADPIPGLTRPPTGDTIDAVIEGFDPGGWWKLDEDSGSVAHDSSGNGLDMTVPVGRTLPGWGAAAGPPGTQAADFGVDDGTSGTSTESRVERAWADLGSSSWTIGLFVNMNGDVTYSPIMGQGNTGHGSSSLGWEIGYTGSSGSPNHRFFVGGAFGFSILADNATLADAWAFVAVTKAGTNPASSTWRFYVNGLEQGSAYTGSFAPNASGGLWIGTKDGINGWSEVPGNFVGSYAFLIPSVLSGADLLSIYESATIPEGANEGKALLATGLGATYWDYAIEVTY